MAALLMAGFAIGGAGNAQTTTPDGIGLFGDFPGPGPDGIQVVAGPRLAEILEAEEDGSTVMWTNNDTAIAYRVRALSTFHANGKPCRTFSLHRASDDSVHESYRTACRHADGQWRVTTVPGGPGDE